MEDKTKIFLNQINRKIERLKEDIEESKKDLASSTNESLFNITRFGIAKYAEQITKLSGQIMVLEEQKHNFISIFGIKEEQ